MAVDMVRDVELDGNPSDSTTAADVTPNQIDGVRTYLSCYYLLTAYAPLHPPATPL